MKEILFRLLFPDTYLSLEQNLKDAEKRVSECEEQLEILTLQLKEDKTRVEPDFIALVFASAAIIGTFVTLGGRNFIERLDKMGFPMMDNLTLLDAGWIILYFGSAFIWIYTVFFGMGLLSDYTNSKSDPKYRNYPKVLYYFGAIVFIWAFITVFSEMFGL